MMNEQGSEMNVEELLKCLGDAIMRSNQQGVSRPMMYVAGYMDHYCSELSELIIKLQQVVDKRDV